MKRRSFLMLGAGALAAPAVSLPAEASPLVEETCGGCRFWEAAYKGCPGGECRRHAPTEQRRYHLVAGGVRGYEAVEKSWPAMLRSGWCGDWEAVTP